MLNHFSGNLFFSPENVNSIASPSLGLSCVIAFFNPSSILSLIPKSLQLEPLHTSLFGGSIFDPELVGIYPLLQVLPRFSVIRRNSPRARGILTLLGTIAYTPSFYSAVFRSILCLLGESQRFVLFHIPSLACHSLRSDPLLKISKSHLPEILPSLGNLSLECLPEIVQVVILYGVPRPLSQRQEILFDLTSCKHWRNRCLQIDESVERRENASARKCLSTSSTFQVSSEQSLSSRHSQIEDQLTRCSLSELHFPHSKSMLH